MKKVLTTLMMVSSAALLMTSCKKETIAPPVEGDAKPATEAALNGRDGGGVLIPVPVYTLTSFDADSLTYYADGRLAKVQHSANSHTQYNYGGMGGNVITAQTFTGNHLDEKIIYQTDVQTGRVHESEEHKYGNLSPTVNYHDKKWFKFEYDADGHLTKKYNKYTPTERQEFHWDSKGDLGSTWYYDAAGKHWRTVEFGHEFFKSDKLKRMPMRSGLDFNLRIFGKGSKSVVNHEAVYHMPSNSPDVMEYQYYTLDAEGYPVKCTLMDGKTNMITTIRSFAIGYKIS